MPLNVSNLLFLEEHGALDSVAGLLEVVGSSEPLRTQLNHLALFVENLLRNVRCSIHLADLATGTLRFGAAPNLPDVYNAAIDGAAFGEGVGSCGTAAARVATVIVADIAKSTLWTGYHALAKTHDLAACWSTPVVDEGGELLGTFAMYYREPHEPSDGELAVLRVAGPLAALVIQRHRDAQRLVESEQRFRSAFEDAAIGKALVSSTGRLWRVNPALCEMLGYSADELLRLDVQAITYPEDLPRDLGFARDMLEGKRTHYEMEKRYIHKSGRLIWGLLSVSLLRSNTGEPLYFVSQVQDVTERKRLEHAVRELTSGEQRRLGRDLHDGLGQELSGLSFLAGAFAAKARRLNSPLADDATTLSAIARQAVATCRDIVRGVSPLTESRGGLVSGIRQLTMRAAEISGLDIQFAATRAAALRLSWDSRNQLFRIAQEALNNALLHGGADSIRVKVAITKRFVKISVEDNGHGLPADLTEPKGLGIETMRYRAAALQAQLQIETAVAGGTVVMCECPQPSDFAAAARRADKSLS